LISWSTTRSQQMPLPGAPCYSLDSSFMVSKAIPWLRDNWSHLIVAEDSTPHSWVNIPNTEKIIVPSASQLLAIRTPLKSANFLPMALICAHDALTCWYSDIIVVNLRVNRSARKDTAVKRVPSKGAYAAIVLIFESFYPLELISIPEMHLFAWSTNR